MPVDMRGSAVSHRIARAAASHRLLLGLTALVLAAGVTLRLPHTLAQDTGIEHHTGTFSVARTQNAGGVSLCYFPAFPYYTGTVDFTIDHRTNVASGTLTGAGAVGWNGETWDTYTSDSGKLHYRSWESGACIQNGRFYISFDYRGTISADLLGSYDPATGKLRMEGDAAITLVMRPIDCSTNDLPTFGSSLPSRSCGTLRINGGSVDDAIRAGQDYPVSSTLAGQTPHLVVQGQRSNGVAGGSIDFVPDVSLAVDNNGVWTSTFGQPSVPATRSPTPTPTATAAAPRSEPSGAPSTVCSDCPDDQWASQRAASWAYTAAVIGVVYPGGGGVGVPATPDQIAASQEQLRQCIVTTLAAEHQKPPAQQRNRDQVAFACQGTIPVQLPVG